ncbi:NFX1-type zinc finger-containing protein 1-like [Amphiura filiformis]|uniref:NFX1-type zinc finger-containing protein 1-like n=1 Tax=Amphiura filiformis TaxID=82378 RepID=UPI003B21D2EB
MDDDRRRRGEDRMDHLRRRGEDRQLHQRPRGDGNGYPHRVVDAGHGRHQGGDSARSERGPRRLGYKSLEAMLDTNPTEIIFRLSSSRSGFIELLKQPDIRRDIKAFIVTLLGRACQSDTEPKNLVKLLNIANEYFLSQHLTQYVTEMTVQYDPRYVQTIPQQIKSITTLLLVMLQRLPRSANSVIVNVLLLQGVIPGLELRCGDLDDETKATLKKLIDYHEEMKRKAEEDRNKAKRPRQVGSVGPPPDNFRELSIFPDINDLNADVEPFLRQNIVRGGYEDADHYLDVQFRLLREDFVRPLRNGIEEYLRMKTAAPAQQRHQRPKDIRIYSDVQIQYPMCSWDGIIYRIHFDQTRFGRVRWQATKRLIFGSLVCLSKDDFQTLLFATVANRNPHDLEQGFVDLRFEDRAAIEDSKDDRFVMAETSAYFEAYRHVLEGLQEVTGDTLCFQKYIIDVTKEVDAPQYLQQNPTVTYDLRPLVSDVSLSDESEGSDEEDLIDSENTKVQIMKQRAWPSAEDMHLDNSQLAAVQMALTKELSVIQGPPGTGKTYIGLKVVQALLYNSRVWCKDDHGGARLNDRNSQTRPLLIVCYTNHALDQFLEGILEFQKSDIVRIGGRSSSEALKSFNLSSLKQEIRKRREVQRFIFETSRDVAMSMGRCRQPMEEAQARINATRHAVLKEDTLLPYMAPRHYSSLVNQCPVKLPARVAYRVGIMLIWLGLDGSFHVAPAMNQQPLLDADDDFEADFEDEDQIEEEADVMEEQRMLDDQDVADNNASRNRFDINTIRHDFALDVEAMNMEEEEVVDEWQQVKKVRKGRMKKLIRRNLESKNMMTMREAERITNVWAIPDHMNRWRLYRYWVRGYCDRQAQTLFEKQEQYERLAMEMKEVRTQEDLAILETTKVIGVTTTGAAKYRALLQRVKPRIIVVEEAAEVLESHIISTLSSDCQQLILIGDHQQLRPNPTVFELAKDFNLEISLFERMVKNGLPCQRLTQQHRMRPEISSIMKLRHFYPTLQDHVSVRNFDDIKGVESNVFFIDHDKVESYIDDTKSHSNPHEADFLIALARYFIQQGYDPSQITILTTYTAQLFNFKRSVGKLASFQSLKSVRVCAVDNFQGEENDIILLSLVRSNEEGSIGFLKVANRVCVALSRARKGLFCIGNFNLLASKGQLWEDIVVEMKANRSFGKSLKLICRNHPDQVTEVSTSLDFLNVPEGGCSKQCEARLACGHACAMSCHPRDLDHKEYKCNKTCGKIISGCQKGHRCMKFCSQKCDKRCQTLVQEDLSCGHIAFMPCFSDPEFFECQQPCLEELQCGHQCKNKCGETCSRECDELVEHLGLPCGHRPVMPCSAKLQDCSHPCGSILLCEHKCSGTCGECQRGRLHKACAEGCRRPLVCGHLCQEPCTQTCPPCQENCTNRCVHSKCQDKCGNPCVSCQELCEWRCKHKECSKLCSEPCDRTPCNEPCRRKPLKCPHPCIGLCGEPCPKKCRICDKEEVTEILFGEEDDPNARFVQLEDCDHFIEVNSMDTWMEQAATGQKVDIQLKECPKCKTIIRRNLRYGNIIKQMLLDIESVKIRMFGDETAIRRKSLELKKKITTSRRNQELNFTAWMHMSEQLLKRLTLEQVTLVENQYNLLSMIEIVRKNAEEGIKHAERLSKKRSIEKQLGALEEWLMEPRMRMSEQQLEDISREIQRLSMVCQMVAIESRAMEQGRLQSLEIQTDLLRVKRMLTDGLPLTDDKTTTARSLLKRLNKTVGGLPISDKERVSIVTAMGLSAGHWFKCPKGHIYAIGDCGGAAEEGICPECRSTIGGTGHRLREGNQLAPEMDNAEYPAWSDEANMANNRFDDLF